MFLASRRPAAALATPVAVRILEHAHRLQVHARQVADLRLRTEEGPQISPTILLTFVKYMC